MAFPAAEVHCFAFCNVHLQNLHLYLKWNNMWQKMVLERCHQLAIFPTKFCNVHLQNLYRMQDIMVSNLLRCKKNLCFHRQCQGRIIMVQFAEYATFNISNLTKLKSRYRSPWFSKFITPYCTENKDVGTLLCLGNKWL